jgi:L-aspartate oxidase
VCSSDLAKKAAKSILENPSKGCREIFSLSDEPLELDGDKEKKDELRRIMWENVSIKRTPQGLATALEAIEKMLASSVGRLLRLRLLTARSIVASAQKRSESIGVHYIKSDEAS